MKIKEYVRFDSWVLSMVLSLFYLLKYFYMKVYKNDFYALPSAGSMFRHTKFDLIRGVATKYLLRTIASHGSLKVGKELHQIISESISDGMKEEIRSSITEEGGRPLNGRLLILSGPINDTKGVLIVKFTESFKYLLQLFDMERLCKDYVIVVEPSYSGYFDEDILQLLCLRDPVIIETLEPVDYKFITDLESNLLPIPLGANHWVDDRVFHPIEGAEKIYDVIMVAIWAEFKRHYHLFEALSKAGKEMRVALVGKPWNKTLEDLKEEATHYGVLHMIDFFEDLSQKKINELLNHSRCLFLLSKKEGVNKAIIEAMYADIPVFILEGFNYGFAYPFINEHTGGFINPRELALFIRDIDDTLSRGAYSPRKWIESHISAKVSTEELVSMLHQLEKLYSIRVNKELLVKINTPEMDYYDNKAWNTVKPSMDDMKKYLRY
ncbi:MAG: glycosyltransferase [Deltaproteobacteria bacterium]|nr:glycosyltransferase [Deltaproteobacteria bacterium]